MGETRDDDARPIELAVGVQRRPTVSKVARSLRQKRIPEDRDFDVFLPRDLRPVSDQHWSPLSVAVKVAEWVDELDVATVIDVGSGPGKLCVAAALASHARFVGIEQRPHLAEAARDLARLFEVDDRVTFVDGALGDVPLPRADAFYFYNPFGENLFGPASHIDEAVELGRDRHTRDVLVAEKMLLDSPRGTIVLTYNGFGGRMPDAYDQIRVDREQPSVLRAWRRI